MHATWNNTYTRLPEHMFARQQPVPVAAPSGLVLNTALADELGISFLSCRPATRGKKEIRPPGFEPGTI